MGEAVRPVFGRHDPEVEVAMAAAAVRIMMVAGRWDTVGSR